MEKFITIGGRLATGPAAQQPLKFLRNFVRSGFWGAPPRVTRRSSIVSFYILIAILNAFVMGGVGWAEEKNWNGQGDRTSFQDAANWLPSGVPGENDDAMVNLKDASVVVSQPYELKSLTIGGKKTSAVSVSNFTEGSVVPENPSDVAILNRKDGTLVLKGSTSKLVVKGSYKDSEEIIPDEPSFMLYVK